MAPMVRDPLRIRLTGRGGQGIMLAGAILAEAAMRAGRHVAQTQEYGPEARLGATKAEVILSTRDIAFPAVDVPDVLLCLSRPGYLRYGQQLAPGGLALVEASLDLPPTPAPERSQLVRLPLRATARALGQELVTNVVGLGALAAVTGLVDLESLRAALRARVKPETQDTNELALARGWEMGLRVREELAASVARASGSR
jgi:2-oxoglutarate ferredoxin oxidoreductase subunit gamma